MGFKTKVRKQLEKAVGHYGYTMSKNPDLNSLQTVVCQEHIPFSESEFAARNPREITLSWVIPPMAPGAGGHRTIFRTIDNLSKQGIRSRVYIYGPVKDLPSEELKQMVRDYYQVDLGENEIYGHIKYMTYSDGLMATSWETAYVANNNDNCLQKFYFVQDFEPDFYGKGSLYYLAENTYRLGLTGITAGHWLDQKLAREYGMTTCGFDFSVDRSIYKPHPEARFTDDRHHIFFYARPFTGRRAFEIGALAFDRLHQLRDDFVVELAGQPIEGYALDFDYCDHGILSQQELSELYSKCDLCFVLSLTNMSLLPYEIMASDSVVVQNAGDNNAWAVNEENSIVTDLNPVNIAEVINRYLDDPQALAEKRRAGQESLSDASWYDVSVPVAEFIQQNIAQSLTGHEGN